MLCVTIIHIFLISGYLLHLSKIRLNLLHRWIVFTLFLSLVALSCNTFSAELQLFLLIQSMVLALKLHSLLPLQTANMKITDYILFLFLWPSTNPINLISRTKTGKRTGILSLAIGMMRITLGGLGLLLSTISTSTEIIYLCLITAFLFLLMGFSEALVGIWRLNGFDAGHAFRAPILSTSLIEFWGKRWNMAVHEFLKREIYLPFVKITSPAMSTILAFLFSGILHELFLSIPARERYGLP